MNKGLIAVLVIALLAIGGILIYSMQSDSGTTSGSMGGSVVKSSNAGSASGGGTAVGAPKEYTVEITSSGFSPSTLEINKGDTVTWINMIDTKSWPASANHPTHTVYPGSDIKKCGTSEEAGIFDACRGLAKGESFSFTFNDVGSWGYHDHLSARTRGTIIVK
jgi:plastocyanin